MLPAAWKVSTKGLLWQVTAILLVESKSSARPTCLQECLGFIDFYSAEGPPPGHKYRKRIDAQLSRKWNVSNRWTFVSQKIWIADKF